MAIITRMQERLDALEARMGELESKLAPPKVTSKSAPKDKTD